jgi:Tfp pilus assembly protein PilX
MIQARLFSRQQGATLLVSLILLVVISLVVLTSMVLSNTNQKAVGNVQQRTEAASAVNDAIEAVISSNEKFENPAETVIPTDPRGISVTVKIPDCTKSIAQANEGSLDGNAGQVQVQGTTIVPFVAASVYTTYWDVRGIGENPSTGARVEVHQGVKVMMSNPCPA